MRHLGAFLAHQKVPILVPYGPPLTFIAKLTGFHRIKAAVISGLFRLIDVEAWQKPVEDLAEMGYN